MEQRPEQATDMSSMAASDRLLLLSHAVSCTHTQDSPCPTKGERCAEMKILWKHLTDCWDDYCLVPNCFASRQVLTHFRECTNLRCATCFPVREEQKNDSDTFASSGVNRQQTLKHQQQRLLLLRHAARCQNADGRCQVTPHCSQMKSLWKHIGQCKNAKCVVQYCVSSRYVLSHYQRCKDAKCLVCSPVRALQQKDSLRGRRLVLSKETAAYSKCSDIINGLLSHNYGWIFRFPVDPVALNLPDYFTVVKQPMDLGTVKGRLEKEHYPSIEEFKSDVNLTFDNALLYNPPGHKIHDIAKEMKEKFTAEFENLRRHLDTAGNGAPPEQVPT